MRSIFTQTAVELATLAVLGLAAARPAQAVTTLDQSFDIGEAAGFIHDGGGGYGQTFTAPADNVLDDFTFYENSFNGQIGFTFSVASWNGISPGPALFTSAPVEDPVLSAPGGTPFLFGTGGLALTPGQSYLAYLSGVSATNVFAQVGSELSYDGHAVPAKGTDDVGGDTAAEGSFGVWTADPTTDTRFVAHFSSAVPEPSPAALFALGLLPLALRRTRRRSA